jgi:hypothetical protein
MRVRFGRDGGEGRVQFVRTTSGATVSGVKPRTESPSTCATRPQTASWGPQKGSKGHQKVAMAPQATKRAPRAPKWGSKRAPRADRDEDVAREDLA